MKTGFPKLVYILKSVRIKIKQIHKSLFRRGNIKPAADIFIIAKLINYKAIKHCRLDVMIKKCLIANDNVLCAFGRDGSDVKSDIHGKIVIIQRVFQRNIRRFAQAIRDEFRRDFCFRKQVKPRANALYNHLLPTWIIDKEIP